jgi:Amidase
LKSYVTVLRDDVLVTAAVADEEIAAGKRRSPLHGIPIAIKEILDTKSGVRTTACSRVRENYVPDQDCTIVRKLREAGAVILGKVTTHEFAFALIPVQPGTRGNPVHIPSGSSGGPGAAIAAGLCFAATGSIPAVRSGLPPPPTELSVSSPPMAASARLASPISPGRWTMPVRWRARFATLRRNPEDGPGVCSCRTTFSRRPTRRQAIFCPDL